MTFNCKGIAQHQYDYLKAATTEHGVTWKIPDTGTLNPFDTMHYKNAPAFVVIVFPEDVCAIHINVIDRNSSIKLEQALHICDYHTKLGEI